MQLKENITGVQHVGIPTADLEKTVKWYETMLGFKTVHKVAIQHHGEVNVAFLELGDLTIESYQPSSKNAANITQRANGYIDHLAINTTDVEQGKNSLIVKGAQLHDSTMNGTVLLETFFSKGMRYVNFVGPNNETVELAQDLALEQPGGHLLKGWSHLGIPVTDINRSKRFYQDLGFENVMNAKVSQEKGTIYVSFMELNGFLIELYQLYGEEREEIKTRSDGHIDHIAFNVLDIDHAFNELKRDNHVVEEDQPSYIDFQNFEMTFFHVRGPDHEKIELNQKTTKNRS